MTPPRRLLLTASLCMLAVPAAFAAEPENGTISTSSPTVEWKGTSGGYGITAANILINAAGEKMVCEAPFCDTFTLEVADGGVDMTLAVTSEDSSITTVEVEKPDGSWEYQNGTEPEGADPDFTTKFRFKKAAKGTWIVRTMSNANGGMDPYAAVAQLLLPAAAAPALPAAPAAPEAPAAPAAPAPSLTVSAPGKLSARKLNRARSLTARVSATAPVTGVTATLRSGKKVVGKGSLASLRGTKKLKLKLSRKLKRGRYTLAVTGKADGTTVGGGAPLKIAR